MTVGELKEVLDERFERYEKHEDTQHGAIITHLERINGRLGKHDDAITGLKIRDAYWAGGVVGILGLIKLLWR